LARQRVRSTFSTAGPKRHPVGVVSPQTLGRAELRLMCYLPLRIQLVSAITVRPSKAARHPAVMSGPASGRPVLKEAARGRSLFSTGSAHVLRRSRVATVALNEFPLGASWSCSAGITIVTRAHRSVVVLAPDTFSKRSIALQQPSSHGLAAESRARFSTAPAGGIQGYSGSSPARPNPSVEPTPNSVTLWPGGGHSVHFPPPGQAATLPGSPHLKR
jgi:hypothetical protein